MRTHEIRISQRYALEHLEASSLPGTFLGMNGRGVLVQLTPGELHELRSRAQHYADREYATDPDFRDLRDLHRSAVKVCEQLKRAGLWDEANTRECIEAYHVEWQAMWEQREQERKNYCKVA
jgi:hypothetical protein